MVERSGRAPTPGETWFSVLDGELRPIEERVGSTPDPWRPNLRRPAMAAGMSLRVELAAPATVRWTADSWETTREDATRDTSLGLHSVDLPTAPLPAGNAIDFTIHGRDVDRGIGRDFRVDIR